MTNNLCRRKKGRCAVWQGWTLVLFAMTLLQLGGCATDVAYREGKELVAQGRVEEGMAKFKESMGKDPTRVESKLAYLQTRERATTYFSEEGDRAASAGRLAAAEVMYQRVLAIDAGNERALAGMQKLKELKQLSTTTSVKNQPTNSVDPKQKTPAPSSLAAAYKMPISIEFKDVALKQVFEVISRSSGLNFVFDKDVRTDQRVTLYLKNSTIESAVYFTLLTNQLDQQVLNENTILIYPNTANKIKDYQELVVRSFFLTNADAKMVASTLKTILKSRDVVVDEKLNMLIVRDSPEAIRLASKLVALHDIAEAEVMLEVEILEVKRNRLFELGIAWPDSLSLTPLASTVAGALTLEDLRHIRRSSLGAAIGSTTINARNQDADANILANPRIRAHNHEKAKILIGDRVPLITTTSTATGFASESISYIDVGLKLDIEPAVHLDNDVSIKIALEVSNIVSQVQTKSGSVAYQIGTRTASTVLRLRDGENQVLAGLINDEDRRSSRKVPGLGELPVLGRLFGSTNDEHQKTEIVLSITPHLIRSVKRPDGDLAEFSSGTEGSLRSRPDGMTQVAIASPLVRLTGTPAPPAPAAIPSPSPMPVPLSTTLSSSVTPRPAASEKTIDEVAGSAQLAWNGAQQMRVGDTFTLQLSMQSVRPITSLPLVITFDKRVLQATAVTEGNFFKQGGAPTIFNSKIDNEGQILITGTRTDKEGATGKENFASINFRALAPANASAIQLLTVAPIGMGGAAISAQVPSPHVVLVEP